MEEFLNIDWNPSLEDILEGDFVNAERLQQESAMYKALKGNLNDPFTDLHEDYEHLVTKELMSQVTLEKREIAQKAQRSPQQEKPEENTQEERSYVPGIVKNTFQFPRSSELNAEQQALALKVLLRFSGSEKPSISAAEKQELQTYMSMAPIISKEQEAFLEFTKSKWDSTRFEVQEEEFINFQWRNKLKVLDSLPRYYTEVENIPFVSSREIGLNFHSICLDFGVVPKIFLPKLTRRVLMLPNTTKINQRFFSNDTNKGAQEKVIFKTPVSLDENCDKLAKLHNVDLVISSGGLNCLARNIDPNIVTPWTLPITVKRINEKNVIFIDKPLPPSGLTALQKNAWLHKYNIKAHLSHPYHCNAMRLEEKYKNLDEPMEESSQDGDRIVDDLNDKKTNEITENIPRDNDESRENFILPPIGHNLFYRLFSIGSSNESQNDLIKTRVENVYRILVRSKSDGSMKVKTNEEHLITIAPKLEHQLALGAEAVSVEEAAKQWMSLVFRPDTYLLRVRMEATSMEFIQFEKRTATSINNEIKRLYGLKPEAALTLLYNVIDTMTGMNAGRYIMRHTVRNGSFACIYKEVDGPGRNVFDLQTIYCGDEFRTIPNSPWPPLDKVVVTPALKLFNRMPAMFYPSRRKMPNRKQNSGKKNQRGTRGGNKGNRGGGGGGRGGTKKQ